MIPLSNNIRLYDIINNARRSIIKDLEKRKETLAIRRKTKAYYPSNVKISI